MSNKQVVGDHDEDEDRISKLPEPILHHILSFLRTKDATKTSVLSKTWNSVSDSFPVLDFNQDYFEDFSVDLLRGEPHKKFLQVVEDFHDYVDNTITRRGTNDISIEKFRLVVYFKHNNLKSRWKDLDRWLNYAVSKNVRHLVLHYHRCTSSKSGWRPYLLPTSIFRAKSLKELDLYNCTFVESPIPNGFSLKKLRLKHVDVDGQALQGLLSNCCSLEELSIVYCNGFRSVSLSSTKLGTVDLCLSRFYVQKIRIEAPNLQFLSISGDYRNILSSLEASNLNKSLKELRFTSVAITDAIIRVIGRFRVLEKLEFNCCSLQHNIWNSSNPHSDLATTSDSTTRLKDVELVADCMNCTEYDSRDVPLWSYKHEMNLIQC